jgi:hypothetical protein
MQITIHLKDSRWPDAELIGCKQSDDRPDDWQVVLCKITGYQPYVTWSYNPFKQIACTGHYFTTLETATADFADRKR